MKSMTGYGAAEGKAKGKVVRAQLSSVNSKRGLDLNISLPRSLEDQETFVREIIKAQVTRARVNVGLTVQDEGTPKDGLLEVDEKALRHYQKNFAALKSKSENSEVSLEFLLKLPGVLKENKPEVTEDLDQLVQKTVKKALNQYEASRKREGQQLAVDIVSRFKAINKRRIQVDRRKDHVVDSYRKQLLDRLEHSGLSDLAEDERIIREVALFADRSDISEEITRLGVHLKEGERLSRLKDPIGKNMDFLLQEMAREINTIGSKANDLEISQSVVDMKTELEKVREQIQNIE